MPLPAPVIWNPALEQLFDTFRKPSHQDGLAVDRLQLCGEQGTVEYADPQPEGFENHVR